MRKLLWIIGTIVMTAAIVVIVGFVFVSRAFPDIRGREQVSGISETVEILRDENGVPHIYAATAEDLYFAQGFVHAQDRFWQMEFWRRIGAGRLSEILGEQAIDQDRYLRAMGFARVAEREYAQLEGDHRRWIEAYSAGVNAYIESRPPARLALEFALLSLTGVEVEVEPWTPVNTLTWGKIMSMDLAANLGRELSNLGLARRSSRGLWEVLRPEYRADMPYIVSTEELRDFRRRMSAERQTADGSARAASTATAPYPVLRYRGGGRGIGSNSWVVGPELTEGGGALLANDMHLSVQMPSIWYEIGLHLLPESDEHGDAELHLRGYSFAGVPGIIVGQNENIAWGFTNIGGDVQDFYLEEINPENPLQYREDGEWRDMEVVYETIHVEGRSEPVVQEVRITPRGPIMTDVPQFDQWFSYDPGDPAAFPAEASFRELSLKWTALRPETTIQGLFDLNRARDFESFRDALRNWSSPAQNMVFADRDGNIGYQSTGFHPARPVEQGLVPRPAEAAGQTLGDTAGGGRWAGLPFADLPASYNPEKGYIVTANNPVIPPNDRPALALDFANGYRAARIVAMVEEEAQEGGLSREDLSAMHADVYSLHAAELLPELERVDLEAAYRAWRDLERSWSGELAEGSPADDGGDRREEDLAYLRAARDVLLAWDARMEEDAAGAVGFGFVWKQMVEEVFGDEFPEQAWPPAGLGTFQTAVYYLLSEPQNPVWDDKASIGVVEDRDDILGRSLVRGLLAAREEQGDRPERWKWGEVHQIEFRNSTLGESGIGLIESIFNRGPFPLAGSSATVNVAHWTINDPFRVRAIASQRAIYDPANPSNSLFIHPTGQSGHPFHQHYDDFIRPWREARYHPARWTREEVEASAGGRRLVLVPDDADSSAAVQEASGKM